MHENLIDTIENKVNYLLISKSPKMQAILEDVNLVAKTRSTILISGESGTGKSVLAKYIHLLSDRRDNKFIDVHCGAIAESLIESELFGHEKGAFTGAIRQKQGKFELADKGTIFLDEISDLSESAQIRLLQVLQERFIQRVGGEENIKIDIRVIAATNTDLNKMVIENKFRLDLYYRLNVFQIEIPPLRQRPEDIEMFSVHILDKLNNLYGKDITSIERSFLDRLIKCNWPGNIRELENTLEKSYVLEKSKILTSDHYPASTLFEATPNDDANPRSSFNTMNLKEERNKCLDQFERLYLIELLRLSKGNMNEAAEIAGVGVRQLNKFLSKHQLNRRSFVDVPSISNLPH